MLTSVEVNGVVFPLKTVAIKRGDRKGQEYMTFDMDKITLAMLEQAWGDKVKNSIIKPKLTTLSQNLWWESWNDEQQSLNEDEFISNLQTLSARGETLGEITDRLMETVDKMGEATDPKEIMELLAEAKSLREAMEKKRRKTKEEQAEAEAAVPTA